MNKIVKLTDAQYFDYPALSQSGIGDFYEHPAVFWANTPLNPDYKPLKKKTDAMIFGSMLHSLLLEGQEKFDSMFAVNDDNRNSNKFKEFKAANENKDVVKSGDVVDAKDVIKILHADKDACKLLDSCIYEAPFAWELPDTDYDLETGEIKKPLMGKMKIDAFKKNGHLIVDYKSTEDLTEEQMNKTITNRGYHRQADWYMKGYEATRGIAPRGFICLFQNKSYPQIIVPLAISHEHLQLGEYENEQAVKDIKRRMQANWWHDTNGIVDSKPADWYKLKGHDLDDKWNEYLKRKEIVNG